MKKWRERRNCMKNQRGFTIVELLIGMTILSIVAVALTGFIVSSSKSYAASNTEIIVQQESQLAMNQISDVIIDTTRSVDYMGYPLNGGVPEKVLKDADFTNDVGDKCLVLYNGEVEYEVDENGEIKKDSDDKPIIATEEDGTQKIDEGNGNKNYQIYWDKKEEKLYFSQIDITETEFKEIDRVLLAEYVKDFSVDLSQVEEKRVVKLTISYGYNNKVYETSNNITIRNKVMVNSINVAVDRTVELSIRPKESIVYLEPGEDYYQFSTPVIDGKNIADKSVTWSIDTEYKFQPTASDTGFVGTEGIANGRIKIGSGEMTQEFRVVVTTNAEDSAGKHASEYVYVRVKRANSVSLNKSEDSGDAENQANEISAGSTITISAHVVGFNLGITCSKCGDDPSIDGYVVENENSYKWSVTDTNGICTIKSSSHESAEFTISPSAQPGQQITIEATSLLSTNKNYDRAFGKIILTVVSHGGDLTLDSDGLKYGSRDVYLKWDYVPHTAYICVRIKEDDNAPASDDKVVIYKTDGKAILIAPDVFGLDLNKNYIIYIQVLAADTDGHGNDIQTPAEVVADYNSHVDSTGTYFGELKASSRLREVLNKPQLTIKYNNKVYTGEEVNIIPTYFLSTAERSVPCGEIIKISSAQGDGINMRNSVQTNLYLADGTALYEWGQSKTGGDRKGLLKYNKEYGKLEIKLGNVDGNDIRNNNVSRMNEAKETIGDYYYIPYFTFTNKTVADSFDVYYRSPNYTPNFDLQTCKRTESKINFSIVDTSSNMSLWAYTNNGEFKKGEILFPIPTESSFRSYFELNNTDLQTVMPNNSFVMQDTDGNFHIVEFSKITCRHIPTDNAYEIELFYKCTDSFWGRKVEMSAGVFKWRPANGTDWFQTDGGTLDLELESTNGNYKVTASGNASITIGGQTKEAYVTMPLPTESAFTQQWWGGYKFDLNEIKTNGEQTVYGLEYNNIKIAYKEGSSLAYVTCTTAKCMYKEGTYTVILNYEGGTSGVVLTLEAGSSEWTVVP